MILVNFLNAGDSVVRVLLHIPDRNKKYILEQNYLYLLQGSYKKLQVLSVQDISHVLTNYRSFAAR